ncbi:MAG: cupin domain-containing protein [Rhodoblastus sp.]|nr:MAG: cupin domain-containing protein [Rhodoblastus sp.]
MKTIRVAAFAALALSATVAAAWAQAAAPAAPAPTAAAPTPTFKRLELVKQMFPPEKYMTWMYMVVVEPGGTVPRHTHPGIEMGYLLEGEATLSVEGQPDLAMKPESTYNVPPGVPHSAKNNGAKPAKLIATFVVEKDKPLASPAPN